MCFYTNLPVLLNKHLYNSYHRDLETKNGNNEEKQKNTTGDAEKKVHTEFKGKSNMITWSTSRSRPLAARSEHTNVGQSPSSLLNFFKFSTLPPYQIEVIFLFFC
jgi:hypothetical protein